MDSKVSRNNGYKRPIDSYLRYTPITMKIALGADHAGYGYKETVKTFLLNSGHEVEDFGTDTDESVDYPLFIRPAAEAVARKKCQLGIVFGGSGNGEAICANKVQGIRCAVCWNTESARLASEHNHANMISIGQRMIDKETALKIVQIWLKTPFEGGRHQRRISMLD